MTARHGAFVCNRVSSSSGLNQAARVSLFTIPKKKRDGSDEAATGTAARYSVLTAGVFLRFDPRSCVGISPSCRLKRCPQTGHTPEDLPPHSACSLRSEGAPRPPMHSPGFFMTWRLPGRPPSRCCRALLRGCHFEERCRLFQDGLRFPLAVECHQCAMTYLATPNLGRSWIQITTWNRRGSG